MALSKSMGDLKMYDDKFVMVASIDFGTTFSGYAFSFKTNQTDIKMNKNWGESVGFQSYKTPTSVLLDANGKMLAFGFDAETKYNAMILSKGKDSGELYRHFKMTLHHNKHLTRKSQVQSVRGKHASAMDIFTHAVQYLKNHMLEAIKKTSTEPPNESLIRWVITVPAIWSEQSKKFMREVAYKAEITKSIDSQHFVICLEPEAASIYCRQLDIDQFLHGSKDDSKLLQKTGAKYMVVDAGGGTIDITVHEIGTEGNLSEIVAATGGPWGGNKVDENFISLLSRLLGKDFINRYRAECPSEWLDWRVNFEKKKKVFDPNDESATISIPLSWGIKDKYQEVTGKNIQQVIQSTSIQGVEFKEGKIVMDSNVVKSFFDPVLKEITDHLEGQLSDPLLADISLILLVGGFGESELLQKALVSAFSPRIKVICPSDASITIIKGAVLFGHSPKTISSRIARKTYGQAIYDEFDASKHEEHRMVVRERGKRCRVFVPYVKKGERINIGEVRTFVSSCAKAESTQSFACFYSADIKNVNYPDDPTVKEIGGMWTNFTTDKGLDREIKTTIYFGLSEIYIESLEVTDGCTGEIASTTIDFLSE